MKFAPFDLENTITSGANTSFLNWNLNAKSLIKFHSMTELLREMNAVAFENN